MQAILLRFFHKCIPSWNPADSGPPGAGKTFNGARMICELVRRGKKVRVTANSHKVIRT